MRSGAHTRVEFARRLPAQGVAWRRRATEGIPQQAIIAAAGHHSIEQNNDYVNMKTIIFEQPSNCLHHVYTVNRLKIRALQVIDFTYARMVE